MIACASRECCASEHCIRLMSAPARCKTFVSSTSTKQLLNYSRQLTIRSGRAMASSSRVEAAAPLKRFEPVVELDEQACL